jgi:hypothetical protein
VRIVYDWIKPPLVAGGGGGQSISIRRAIAFESFFSAWQQSALEPGPAVRQRRLEPQPNAHQDGAASPVRVVMSKNRCSEVLVPGLVLAGGAVSGAINVPLMSALLTLFIVAVPFGFMLFAAGAEKPAGQCVVID